MFILKPTLKICEKLQIILKHFTENPLTGGFFVLEQDEYPDTPPVDQFCAPPPLTVHFARYNQFVAAIDYPCL